MANFNIKVDTVNKTMSVQKDGEDFAPDSFSVGRSEYYDSCYCYLCYTETGDDGMSVTSSMYFTDKGEADASVDFAKPINKAVANIIASIKLSKALKPQGK